jgi:glyoxylase-like metal-dependent hydrolase (beta-lactamase superfamily II)
MGLVVKSFLPQRFATAAWPVAQERTVRPDVARLPAVEVEFLRCGSVSIPECIAVRGAMSFAPRVITHSAVLIRHPRATFLYDTGLCADVYTYLVSQSLLFRKTLANFTLEQPLRDHLQQRGIKLDDLDFALLSHLHWDHVSGIPDIPGVPLRINRVEYDAAGYGLFAANNGIVSQLMCDNPIEYFDCAGPTYEGFRSSYDLFGDGSIVLVPLPGHTAGNTGMFINRSNGYRVFLLGDAAWVSENYLRPATMHPLIWSGVTSDDATARETLIQLHRYAKRHPDIPLIAMHDAALQAAFMAVERPLLSSRK